MSEVELNEAEAMINAQSLEFLRNQFNGQIYIDQSMESLDTLLPRLHQNQSEIEQRTVAYLRSLKLKFQTDPRQKEYDYFDSNQIEVPKLQFVIGVQTSQGDDDIKLKDISPHKQDVNDFNPWINPVLLRRIKQL